MYRPAYDALEQTVPNLAAKILIPSAGHWVQQEQPAIVNRYLTEFLSAAWPAAQRGSARAEGR
jgi:pimeloyl-ACP methyl ester carboxylesterase